MIAVSLLGWVALGSGASNASAWWPWDALFSHHDCDGHICCRQYNAFSPFCCEGAVGYYDGGSPACLYQGDQAYLGELPAPGVITGPTRNTPATPGNSAPPMVGNNAQAIPPGIGPRPGPVWGPGMMNPTGIPGYYPGFLNYGPASGVGGPSYYPGFIGSGPANGFGRF